MILSNHDLKYPLPKVGPIIGAIVERMVKATNVGNNEAGKVITQSICQQIIYRLAGSLGLNIAAKNAYENSENKSSIIAKIIFNEFKNRLMV